MSRSPADKGNVNEDVLRAVREDSGLTPEEKETVVRFGKRDDEAIIHTREAGIARRLLAHPESTVVFLNVYDEDGAAGVVEAEAWDGESVTGVEARLPVGALKVQLSARSSTQHAEIVSGRVLDQ